MTVITKGFTDPEVAERIGTLCKERAEQGLSEFNRFGQLYGRVFDIAYKGNGTIVITNN